MGAWRKDKTEQLDVVVAGVNPLGLTSVLLQLASNQQIEYAELDAQGSIQSNDAHSNNQYALMNKEQTVNGRVGVPDADIDAPEAWAVSRGEGVRVAVLDTGIDQDHTKICRQKLLPR